MFDEIKKILLSSDKDFVLSLVQKAKEETIRQFGKTISLYAPLYISNYCDNECLYCGFNAKSDIGRGRLETAEIEAECKEIAKTGIKHVLVLTGESRKYSSIDYIESSIKTIAKYFPDISIEIYPLETDEYKRLCDAGVDGLTIYQETYNRDRYAILHPKGKKRDFDYRFGAPERGATAGIRKISMGVLLGLSPWVEDVLALFRHLNYLQDKFTGVEFSLSFPRIRKIDGDTLDYYDISDFDMVKIISVARIFFPTVGINLSTRESETFRDAIFEYGVTNMSAGSSTKVGGYSGEKKGTSQFEINDSRGVLDIKNFLISRGYDPVFTSWRRI